MERMVGWVELYFGWVNLSWYSLIHLKFCRVLLRSLVLDCARLMV